MANTKQAILRAKIEGILTDLMVKTTAENVYVGDTTLAAQLAGIIADIANRPTTTAMDTAISTAISGLIGGAPETYDTLKEIADYIAEHQDVVDTLNAAIGNKADKTAVEALQTAVNALGALASKDKVTETDLDADLKEKVNAAAEGNHSHANKAVLDGINADKVAAWDGKSKIYYAATQPAAMADGDLWVQLID